MIKFINSYVKHTIIKVVSFPINFVVFQTIQAFFKIFNGIAFFTLYGKKSTKIDFPHILNEKALFNTRN